MAQSHPPWPPPLSSHVMTFVPSLSCVVLFGGSNPARAMSSTLWSWDGSTWRAYSHAESGPPPRIHAGMAYDLRRDRLVVFGGIGADAATLADLWEWDGERWTKIETQGNGPGARDHHALAYDPVLEKVILYGGQDGADRYRSDTWSWDGSVWMELVGDVDAPPARATHRLATDVEGGRVLLFGGWGESGLFNDLWEWNGRAWSAITLSGATPPPIGATRYAFDDEQDALVLFGGRVNDASVADTWILEGNAWRHREAREDGPEARNVHGMAYDADRRRIVLYGGIGSEGRLDDLWEWDWAAQSWSRIGPPD